ncbi:hypothetical protein EB796_010342 [Bugula neritina]|uniref:Secreted protein n=1 Tax=Bugula neritina TaxID=10212 RepID=A0A7J7JZI5_BUGNE|nr:hypothetical protein EB796_010342 [Bugula neritina]
MLSHKIALLITLKNSVISICFCLFLGNCSKDTFYLTDCACSLSKKSHATRNYALTHSQVATDLSVWLILVSAGFAVTCN